MNPNATHAEITRAIQPCLANSHARPPLVVALISTKGGTGKTTLALNLAGAACDASVPAAVLDLDPQGSASLWSDVRTRSDPPVHPTAAEHLAATLQAAAAAGLRLIFLDTAPHSEGATLSAVRAADLVVVPCGISLLDIHATAITLELASLGRDTVSVLSQVPPRGRLKCDVRDELESCDLHVLRSEIGHRMAFRYALQDGTLVQHFAPKSKAAGEIAALWAEIAGRLCLSEHLAASASAGG